MLFFVNIHERCCIFGRVYSNLSYYLFFFVAWSLPIGFKNIGVNRKTAKVILSILLLIEVYIFVVSTAIIR